MRSPSSIYSAHGVINVSSVRQLSPFRYPGGKTWLVPYIRQWLAAQSRPKRFLEPFAGGASVGLAVAVENLADKVTLADIDEDISAVWNVVLNGQAGRLASKIAAFKLSRRSVTSLLSQKSRTPVAKAFQTIVKNRVRRGGILRDDARMLKRGENGKGIRSRWYPETLRDRIKSIRQYRRKITFVQRDALILLKTYAIDKECAFFIDPPYSTAGPRLYRHSEIDHRKLFAIASELKGPVLMSYENAPEIRELARAFGFKTRRLPMKTAHHSLKNELLISREFSWLKPSKLVQKHRR